jgi:hypothetical protein
MLDWLIVKGVRSGVISAERMHNSLLGNPKIASYAKVISTSELSAVISAAAETLSCEEIESLVR